MPAAADRSADYRALHEPLRTPIHCLRAETLPTAPSAASAKRPRCRRSPSIHWTLAAWRAASDPVGNGATPPHPPIVESENTWLVTIALPPRPVPFAIDPRVRRHVADIMGQPGYSHN